MNKKLRIFIITMDDPIETNKFISKIIEARRDSIVGIAVSKGGRLTIGKKRSKIEYLISLLLILGIYQFIKNSLITIFHRIRKKLNKIFPALVKDPTIIGVAKKFNLPTWEISSPNDKHFLEDLSGLNIDIIINQSQSILKKEILNIPSIGIINRHNALLPKNRGRLTPFWVLYNGEKETGVSIHFVTEKLDAGDIIVQERYTISPKDNFNSLVRKNYEIAPKAMLKALDILENGVYDFIKNDDKIATYNTIPTLRDAIRFRLKRLHILN